MIQDFLQRLAAVFDQSWIPWKKLIYGFTIGEFCLENWLLFRQYRVLKRDTVPKALENDIEKTTFDKSQTYGRAKAKYSFVRSCFDVVKSLATVHFDLFPKVWSIAGFILPRFLPARFQGEITQSLVFIFLFNIVDTIYGLPFSYYHTFVLEERFGFNKTTLKTWITDLFKGQALTIAFGVPIGSAFLKIIQMTGQSFFYYLWVFMLFVQISAMTIYPIWIMPLFNKLTPLEAGPLKDRVDALAAKLKFPLSELLVIDGSKRSSHSNAFFAGLPWKKRIVIYDTLLQKSTTEEVEAVLAHELGHWKRGHTTRLLLISQVQTFYIFALFSAFMNNGSLFRDFGFYDEKPIIIGFLLYSAVSSCTEPLLSLGMHMLTRAYEYEADAFAVGLGYTEHLCTGLIKLQVQNLSSMDADWMYSSFHYTHPILVERLRAMGWKGQKKAVQDEEKPAAATGREL